MCVGGRPPIAGLLGGPTHLLFLLVVLQVDALNHECPGTSLEASQVSVAHIPAPQTHTHIFTLLRVLANRTTSSSSHT